MSVTQRAIADHFGISRERVNQIERDHDERRVVNPIPASPIARKRLTAVCDAIDDMMAALADADRCAGADGERTDVEHDTERRSMNTNNPAGRSTDDPLAGRLLVTVPQAQELLGFSRTRIYRMIQLGELRSVSVGRRRMIPAQAIRDYVDALVAGS